METIKYKFGIGISGQKGIMCQQKEGLEDWGKMTIPAWARSSIALHIHINEQEMGYIKGLSLVFYCTVLYEIQV